MSLPRIAAGRLEKYAHNQTGYCSCSLWYYIAITFTERAIGLIPSFEPPDRI